MSRTTARLPAAAAERKVTPELSERFILMERKKLGEAFWRDVTREVVEVPSMLAVVARVEELRRRSSVLAASERDMERMDWAMSRVSLLWRSLMAVKLIPVLGSGLVGAEV
jgi:hypothetical protein